MRRLVGKTPRECLGMALRNWREKEGVSGSAFGARFGAAKFTVSRYELGAHEMGVLDMLRAGIDIPWVLAEAEKIATESGVDWPGSAV